MDSDDLTQNLTDDKSTQPTMKALLERINQIGELVTGRIDRLEESQKAGLAELERNLKSDMAELEGRLKSDMAELERNLKAEIAAKAEELRREMDQGFRRVERMIGLLNNDFLRVRGDHEDVLGRVELLETKAS